MIEHDIIVIGTSAGGVDALKELVSGLPQDMPAALFVVIHTSPTGPGILPQVLGRSGTLTVVNAVDKDEIRYGHMYVAPPDHHLLVEEGCVRLSKGPKENRHRPAIDPLFRSAAYTYGSRVVGVVLTGLLDDGTAGMLVIKTCGGTTIVQDPNDAVYADMPRNVLEHVEVDYCLSLSQIASHLVEITKTPFEKKAIFPVPGKVMIESGIPKMKGATAENMEKIGNPSPFTCPECSGNLWEIKDGKLFRFRCRQGHAYSPSSLLTAQSDTVESALWAALRAMEENADFYQRMAVKERELNNTMLAKQYEENAKETEVHIETLLHVVLKGKKPKM
ncbi:MAG: chemotaxis protein CheB [wastewater metagenome]|nr:chemotaxis protein CheB [Candidatus Loosdrechtia aerotolerans]